MSDEQQDSPSGATAGEPAKVTVTPSTSGTQTTAAAGNGAGLLTVDHLKVLFPVKAGLFIDRTVAHVHAVDDVSFTIGQGETLGVVGESGCGKTTLIRALVRLIDSTGGQIKFRDQDITKAKRRVMQPIRREVQMVFQDPQASLNPRKRISQILAIPLKLRGVRDSEVESESRALLERVGMRPEHLSRFPHEFSGGQRQRVGIARALAMNPKLILLDEPVSALDVSVQAQVINLLQDLQNDLGLSYVFVAHDLSVVRHVSDRIAVLYLGKMMELSPSEELYTKPIHPYSTALLAAIPIPDPKENRERTRTKVTGEVPSPIDPPAGCRFAGRCPRATDVCRQIEPQLTEYVGGHLAACHNPQNVTAEEIAAAKRSPLSPISSGEQAPTYTA
jgi:oligopeptide/dipeptide ABC transporter ATP-binding protein